jgi:dienelactone hydrolase
MRLTRSLVKEAIRGRVGGDPHGERRARTRCFPDEQVHRLADALSAARVDHTIETYPARHGWVPSDTPVHDSAAADRHFETLTALLRGALAT